MIAIKISIISQRTKMWQITCHDSTFNNEVKLAMTKCERNSNREKQWRNLHYNN